MQKSKSRLSDFLTSAFGKIITFIVIFISLYPIIWVFLSSFKKNPGGLSLPTEWVFDGYITIFTKLNILTYFKNSFIITIASTAISVLFIPAISISLPIYQLLGNLGLKDTHLGVIFIYSGLGIATTYFILRSYFLTIPKEMEEAARIDGCGYVGSFFKIIVPIAKPGISTAAIMAFLNNWNEFYFASILLKSKEKMTLPALLGQFTTAYSKNLNGMFSAIIVTVVPTIIIFWIFSETFVKSLTAGAVKG